MYFEEFFCQMAAFRHSKMAHLDIPQNVSFINTETANLESLKKRQFAIFETLSLQKLISRKI